MLFNSYIFILVFLPIVIMLYFGMNRLKKFTLAKWILIVSSVMFLGYYSFKCAIVLAVSIIINFLINQRLAKQNGKTKKVWLAIGIIINVLFLGFFKYANFFAENIIMPLGISFYTFQQIAYMVDSYRGEVEECSFVDYLLFVSYFPKLIQGPIAYHNELLPQFQDEKKKHLDFGNFARGITLFSQGLFKKVLLADNFGKIVDYGYSSITNLNSFEAILVIIGYTLQIYFDFSGYCDMAMGVSNMLNIELPWNFNSPYKAKNISEFWKCWHMTLTRFLTKYIYIPLGGNRKGTMRMYINIIIVYLVSGLWHGAGYTFIVWGVLHGLATVLYRMFKKTYDKIPSFIQWGMTFAFVNVSWIFFRAPNVTDAFAIMKQVLTGGWRFAINAELTETLLQPTLISVPCQFLPIQVVVICAVIIAILACVFLKNNLERIQTFKPTLKWMLVTYMMLVIGILSLSGVSTFLYTNF